MMKLNFFWSRSQAFCVLLITLSDYLVGQVAFVSEQTNAVEDFSALKAGYLLQND